MTLTVAHPGLVRRLFAACTLGATLCATLGTTLLHAQADSAKKEKQQLFTMTDAAIGVGFTALTFAVYPSDKSMAQRMQTQRTIASESLDQLITGFDRFAVPGVLVASAGAYAFGKLAHEPTLADIGWHTSEAMIVGAIATELVKGFAGRSRPFVTADSNPHDWNFGAGFGSESRQSFPSGHTMTAFAAAAALSSEVQLHWPRYAWPARIALYGGASMVGLARMYRNQHWASDVALGAGIGTMAGLKTVRYGHLHENNFVDKILLHTTVVPAMRGGSIGWSAAFR